MSILTYVNSFKDTFESWVGNVLDSFTFHTIAPNLLSLVSYFTGVEIMQLQTDSGKLVVKNQWPAIFLAAVFAYMIIDCFIGVYGVHFRFSKKAKKIWKRISQFCFDLIATYTVLQKYRHTRNFLETRVIIKILKNPCYPINVD